MREIIDSLQHAECFPSQTKQGVMVVNELLSELEMISKALLNPTGSTPTGGELRTRINSFVIRLTQKITNADCVFVRRMNTDGSAVLSGNGELLWSLPENKRIGRPPLIKPRDAGVSTAVLNRENAGPEVVADVFAAEENLRRAHQRTLEQVEQDPAVREFVNSIRAEFCVPFLIKGKTYAGIIGVRSQPYDTEECKKIKEELRRWQPILSFLYHTGLEIEHDLRLSRFVSDVGEVLLSIASSATDDEFLRKMATVFTSEKGLEWHRMFLFTFTNTYPSDAVCVMALGNDGHPDWSKKQAEYSFVYDHLDDYLLATQDPDYAHDDSLYQRLLREESLAISSAELEKNPTLHSVFSAQMAKPIRNHLQDGVIRLDKDDPWFQSLGIADELFSKGLRCDRFLAPLVHVRQSICEPIGFLIMDNPYPHFVETKYTPGLVRLFCDLFTPHLAARGAGMPGWTEKLAGERRSTRRIFSEMDRILDQNTVQIAKRMAEECNNPVK